MVSEKVAVVIPTWNEVENVPVLLSELFSLGQDIVAVYVMDDTSTDGTVEVVERLAALHENLHLVKRTGPRGYGRACAEGLQRAMADGADVVLQMDADRSHEPRYIPAMLEASQHADVVLGSRYVDGISVVNWSLRRLLLSTGANHYVRALAGLRLHDCTTGFRLWRREILGKIDLSEIRSEGYGFLVETLFRATRAGARVAEVPIIFIERRSGQSKLSRKVFVESVFLPWRLLGQRLWDFLRRLPRLRTAARPPDAGDGASGAS